MVFNQAKEVVENKALEMGVLPILQVDAPCARCSGGALDVSLEHHVR